MNKGILMISLGRLLMNIDLEEIFKNAFEIAKKNGLPKYKDELENTFFSFYQIAYFLFPFQLSGLCV